MTDQAHEGPIIGKGDRVGRRVKPTREGVVLEVLPIGNSRVARGLAFQARIRRRASIDRRTPGSSVAAGSTGGTGPVQGQASQDRTAAQDSPSLRAVSRAIIRHSSQCSFTNCLFGSRSPTTGQMTRLRRPDHRWISDMARSIAAGTS